MNINKLVFLNFPWIVPSKSSFHRWSFRFCSMFFLYLSAFSSTFKVMGPPADLVPTASTAAMVKEVPKHESKTLVILTLHQICSYVLIDLLDSDISRKWYPDIYIYYYIICVYIYILPSKNWRFFSTGKPYLRWFLLIFDGQKHSKTIRNQSFP